MSCNCNCNITINAGGTPYIANMQVTVGTEAVDIALGWRRIPSIGRFIVRMENAIPSDATTTLPVTLTLNGITKPLTLPNGDAVTVADVTGVVVMDILYDKWNNILALLSRTTV